MGVATENEWLDVVQQYEKDVQFKREDEKVGIDKESEYIRRGT